MKTIVLITRGKWDSVDYAEVRTFDDVETARIFCTKVNTGHQKYWTSAEIVNEGEEIELRQPET